MSEDIRVMTAQLAADPTSLVFLALGEMLRRRRQLEAAQKVALAGLARYPDLPDAHDLYARILGDLGDTERAFDEWEIALRLEPGHVGAHKGLGFLYFVGGDLERAQRHLETAFAGEPEDEGVAAALERVRIGLQEDIAERTTLPIEPPARATPPPPPRASGGGAPAPAPTPVPRTSVPATVSGWAMVGDEGIVLADLQGHRLAGRMRAPTGDDVSDAVAAHLAAAAQEAARAARLLGLGVWSAVVAESHDGNLLVTTPTEDSVLALLRDTSMPVARLRMLGDRASTAAREWLEDVS